MHSKDEQEITKSGSLYRERLSFLLSMVWEKAAQGDYHAIDRTLKIIETIAKLDTMDGAIASKASADEKIDNSFADLSDFFSRTNLEDNSHVNN